MGTSEAKWRITLGRAALRRGLIGVVAAVVVTVAHELARDADRVRALELERRAGSTLLKRAALETANRYPIRFAPGNGTNHMRAIGLIRRIGTVLPSVAPLVLHDACAVIALTMSSSAFAQRALRLVQAVAALYRTIAHLQWKHMGVEQTK